MMLIPHYGVLEDALSTGLGCPQCPLHYARLDTALACIYISEVCPISIRFTMAVRFRG